MRFSPSTLGWYPEHIEYLNLPDDIVDVPGDLYESLRGKLIEAGLDGLPREYVPPPPTFEQRAAALLAGVDEFMNAAARAKRYDDIRSAALRAGYPGPFRDEGAAYATWMDSVYATCYQIMEQVQANEIPEPSLEQLLQMLPVLQLPE